MITILHSAAHGTTQTDQSEANNVGWDYAHRSLQYSAAIAGLFAAAQCE